jgi:hypothetical protein
MMWIYSISLITGFLFLAAINVSIAFRGYFKRAATDAWVPLVGGAFGAIGVSNLPIESLQEWWWVPLLVDLGSLPAILYMAWRAVLIRSSESA